MIAAMLFMLFLFLVVFVIGILGTVFWIWMLIDCAQNKRLDESQKLMWILLIVFTHLLGALIYFFVGRNAQPRIVTPPLYTPNMPQQQYTPSMYQQGYRPQGPVAASSQDYGAQGQQQNSYEQYEQPRATYPEQYQENS